MGKYSGNSLNKIVVVRLNTIGTSEMWNPPPILYCEHVYTVYTLFKWSLYLKGNAADNEASDDSDDEQMPDLEPAK